MKNIFTIIVSVLSVGFVSAQKKLPVIKANGTSAVISEEDNGLITEWNIDPSIKLDTYTVSKISSTNKIVKIKTDIDSIKIKLKRGEKKDFVILLNGKDSCITRIESLPAKNFSKNGPVFKDTIKMQINEQNTMFIKAALNKTDSLTLNFDTGTSDLVLTRETLKNKIKQSLKSGVNILQIGNKQYQDFKIYPAELTGHGTDGRFGWDLFDGMVVELNYDKGIMVVHSEIPKYVKNDDYSKLKMKYFNNVFLAESTISQDGIQNKNWYLFDTGYQRTLMLDGPLLKEQNFPVDKMKILKKVVMKDAQGNEIPVITSDLQTFTLGNFQLKNVPAQMMSKSRMISGSRMHIVGNEVLKRFNVFLDFQNNMIYLKPNKLIDNKYTELN